MAKVVEKCGIKREKGWLYYLDKKGHVSRAKMARGGGKPSRTKPQLVTKAGVEIHYMNQAEFNQWLEFAKETAWKEYAQTVDGGQELLDLALDAMK